MIIHKAADNIGPDMVGIDDDEFVRKATVEIIPDADDARWRVPIDIEIETDPGLEEREPQPTATAAAATAAKAATTTTTRTRTEATSMGTPASASPTNGVDGRNRNERDLGSAAAAVDAQNGGAAATEILDGAIGIGIDPASEEKSEPTPAILDDDDDDDARRDDGETTGRTVVVGLLPTSRDDDDDNNGEEEHRATAASALGCNIRGGGGPILPLGYYGSCRYDAALETVLTDEGPLDRGGGGGEAPADRPPISDRFHWRVLPPSPSPIVLESVISQQAAAEPAPARREAGSEEGREQQAAPPTAAATEASEPSSEQRFPAPPAEPTPAHEADADEGREPETSPETATEGLKPPSRPQRFLCSFRKPTSSHVAAIEDLLLLPNGLLAKARGRKDRGASSFVTDLLESRKHRAFENKNPFSSSAVGKKQHKKKKKERFVVTLPVYSTRQVGREDSCYRDDDDDGLSWSSCSSIESQLDDLFPPDVIEGTSNEAVPTAAGADASKRRNDRERGARKGKPKPKQTKRREGKANSRSEVAVERKESRESRDASSETEASSRERESDPPDARFFARSETEVVELKKESRESRDAASEIESGSERENAPPNARLFAPDPPGFFSTKTTTSPGTARSFAPPVASVVKAATRRATRFHRPPTTDPGGGGDDEGSVFSHLARRVAETLKHLEDQQQANRTRLQHQRFRHRLRMIQRTEQRRADVVHASMPP